MEFLRLRANAGLRCSAITQAQPMLNNFRSDLQRQRVSIGQRPRDGPIYQDPSYWPIMFRTTPVWHRGSKQTPRAVDATPGDASSGLVERSVTTSGFDVGGVDVVTAGTLYNNIFVFRYQPSISNSGIGLSHSFRLASMVSLDHTDLTRPVGVGLNLIRTHLSRKRTLTLSNTRWPLPDLLLHTTRR